MNARDTLINLFSVRTVDEIDSTPEHVQQAFFVRSFAELRALPDYPAEFERVRTVRKKIEEIKSTNFTLADRALQCLAELKTQRDKSLYVTPDYMVTRELIKRTLYNEWSEPDRLEFDKRREVIETWVDLFLSYTNRDAYETNKEYETLISSAGCWPADTKNLAKINYLSRVVAKYFEQSYTRGFADYRNLKCGDDIKENVGQYCRSAIAMVQLVEVQTLTEPRPPMRNWCHWEYDECRASALPGAPPAIPLNRRFFILARGGTLAAVAPPERRVLAGPYKNWFSEMKTKVHVVVDDFSPEFKGLRLEVKKLADQIIDAREDFTNAMLGSW